jgi:hypothetical protein
MWGAVAQVVVQLVHLLPAGCHAGHILGHTVVQLCHLLGHMLDAVSQVAVQLIHLLPVSGHVGHLLGHPSVQLGLCHLVVCLVHWVLLHVNCYLLDGTQHTWWQPSL